MGFQRFGELRWLCLEGNNLEELPVDLFAETPRLRVLQLTGPFESSDGGNCWPPDRIQPQYISMCKKHNAAGNKLRSIPSGVFRALGDLQILMLHHNRLQELPSDVFNGLVHLKVLKILDNAAQFDLTHPAFDNLLRGRTRCAKGRASRGKCLQLDLDEDTGDELEDLWMSKRQSF